MAKIIDSSTIEAQASWARETFGPGYRPGTIKHLRKELLEIEADPSDCEEWIDALILVIDGATRSGHDPQKIIDTYHAKMFKNRNRTWPDWRGMSLDDPIEHVR